MATLTVITLTLNEERNIVSCLETVRWADEILVIDSGSTDATVALARTFTERVFTIAWEGYGAARNFALGQAAGDWILWLDADERLTPELADEIREILRANRGEVNGYAIARRAYFLGRWIRHCGWYPGRVTRLFRKGKGRFNETRVHEHLHVEGRILRTRHDLLHLTDPDLQHYLHKFNRYTSLAAEDMVAAGRHFSLADLLFRPPFQFVKMYLLRRGFLDGVEGLILSVLSSAYVFTKYAKLWEKTHQHRSGSAPEVPSPAGHRTTASPSTPPSGDPPARTGDSPPS
ncbi:MAG TPA: glycosyltransferase family 2 protein [Bacteroidota bacterium]|nr:glycosyltransferase family 2 protein [Bacteroidota bacterium]